MAKKRAAKKATKKPAAKKKPTKVAAQPKPLREIKWYGWKPDVPDVRDHKVTAPAPTFYPDEAFLATKYLPSIRNQGAQGSCTGHGVRSLGQYIRAYQHNRQHEISPHFIYYNARVIENTVNEDAGAEIRDCIKVVSQLGFAYEHDCPYKESNFTKKPTSTAYSKALKDVSIDYARPEQTEEALKAAIVNGWGFVFGFAVYENFESQEVDATGVMRMPKGKLLGGHCVWAVGYDDNQNNGETRGAFLIANSWGTDWGCRHPNIITPERGHFWMPYRYITDGDLCDDFWVIHKIS